jgi:ArsR family transcriptional regulator, arsenate/arsenite/antimonite-responsive transcriptional repressor
MPLAATDTVDLMFRAFSDRTRLRILNLLRCRNEICVCDIVRVLDQPQAKVSRHLAYLRRAGLVAGRRRQQWMHYRLRSPAGRFHRQVLACLDCCLSEVPMLRADRSVLGRSRLTEPSTCCPPEKE